MTTPLPAAPSLEQLRKQAKELVRERTAGSEPLRLSEAQRDGRARVRLRELAAPEGLRRARHGATGRVSRTPSSTTIGYYEDRAEGLRSVVASGLANGIAVVRAHHPALARRERRRDPRDQRRRTRASCSRASTASRAGTRSGATSRAWPRAASRSGARSRRSRRATARRSATCSTATRDSSRRAARTATTCSGSPRAGGAITTLVRELLARGADPSSANDRGWTPLHQAGYGNDAALARLLLEAGARTDVYGHGEGGTPLAAALFWGNTEVADAARRARDRPAQPAHRRRARAARPDPRARAATTGASSAAAGAARGFYRPHSGFPIWEPSDDPQEILDEALVWAAKSDRVDVLGPLVELGADVERRSLPRDAADLGRRRAATSRRSGGWSSSAPTRAARRRSAGPSTARA